MSSKWGRHSVCLFLAASLQAAICDVRDFGASGDGVGKDSSAFEKAIAACSQKGGGVVLVPPGRYLTGVITLRSHITLEVSSGATILASEDPADYPVRESVWEGEAKSISSLIYAADAEDVTITGRGTIDGQGQVWWKRQWLAFPRRGTPPPTSLQDLREVAKVVNGRPNLIEIVRSKNVVIEKVSLINSPRWTVHPLLCEFVRVDGVTIHNPVPSPNTDGINPESCRNVQIMNSRIDVGDDCVTLKSGMNEAGRKMARPNENITITNCVMLKGHGGVVIGSEMSGGVRNVVVSNCVFQGTDVGIRIKSQRGRGGVVEGLTASNIVMQDVRSAFTITTFYMGKDKPGDVFPVDEGTPRFRDFHFSNITARGSMKAGEITGLREMPIEDITFSNVHVQAKDGFTCTNARQVSFYDVSVDTDAGPALAIKDCSDVDTARLHTLRPHAGTALVTNNAK